MSGSQGHKKQHYVPQTYLKYYAHNLGNQEHPKYITNVYSKIAHKSFEKNIEDISKIDYFYNISDDYLANCGQNDLHKLSIELDYFANGVETNLGNLLEEIQRRKDNVIKNCATKFPMFPQDKMLFAEQIIIQFLRHPKMREYDVSFFDEISSKINRLFTEGLAKELNCPEIAKLQIFEKRDDVVTHAKLSFLNNELITKFAKALSEDTWIFLYNPSQSFMTSNNPIVCQQLFIDERPFNLGLNQKGSKKLYALSPDLLLVILDKYYTAFEDCEFGYAPQICIDEYHQALYSQSDELYSYLKFDKDFSI